MRPRWVVIANRTDAVFYLDGTDRKFHFVDRLTNRKGDKTEGELASDRPGSGLSSDSGAVHFGFGNGSPKRDRVAARFARRIAGRLSLAFREGRFASLVLVAEPRFLGLLRAELDPRTSESVEHEIHREFKRGSDEELRERIYEAIAV